MCRVLGNVLRFVPLCTIRRNSINVWSSFVQTDVFQVATMIVKHVPFYTSPWNVSCLIQSTWCLLLTAGDPPEEFLDFLVWLSLLCWQAAHYCTVWVEIKRLESAASPWLWFVIVKVWYELRAGNIFLLSLLRWLMSSPYSPADRNWHLESFLFFSHQRLFAEGHLC